MKCAWLVGVKFSYKIFPEVVDYFTFYGVNGRDMSMASREFQSLTRPGEQNKNDEQLRMRCLISGGLAWKKKLIW